MAPAPRRRSISGVDPWYRALAGYLIGLAVLEIAALSFSVARVPLTRAPALTCLVLALLCGCAAGWRLPRGSADPIAELSAPAGWPAGALIAGGAIGFLLLAMAAYLAPDLSWDGNLYHLPTLQFWAQEGYVHWVDERFGHSDLANGYPKGAELVGFVLVRAFEDGNLVNTFNLVFLPLGVLGIASLARNLGVSHPAALAAGSAYLMVPANVAQSGTTYIDAAYGAAVIAFLAAAVPALRPVADGAPPPWTGTPVLGAGLGLVWAIRPTGFLLAAIFCALLVATWWAARRVRTSGATVGKVAGFLSVVLAGALLVGGYWYARNLRMTGNPFYPLGVRVGGWTLLSGRPLSALIFPEGHAAIAHPGLNWPMQILHAWVQGPADWPASIHDADSREGGLGFLWIAGCVPAIGWMAARAFRPAGKRPPLRPALFLALMVFFLFLATPMRWWARYTIWLYALGLPCLARALQEARDRLPRPRLAAFAAAAIAGLALAEGAVAMKEVLGRSYPGPRPVHLSDLFQIGDWRWPDNYLFRSTRGTLFDQVVSSAAAVAVGPMVSPTRKGQSHALVFGQLATPLGLHRVVPVGDPLSRRDRDRIRESRVRYLLWDGTRDPPLQGVPGLRTVRAAGLWVLVLPASGLPSEDSAVGPAEELPALR